MLQIILCDIVSLPPKKYLTSSQSFNPLKIPKNFFFFLCFVLFLLLFLLKFKISLFYSPYLRFFLLFFFSLFPLHYSSHCYNFHLVRIFFNLLLSELVYCFTALLLKEHKRICVFFHYLSDHSVTNKNCISRPLTYSPRQGIQKLLQALY